MDENDPRQQPAESNMADPINPLYLKILDACRAQSPEPLYPKPFSIAENLDRQKLDQAFDYLRLHGLVRLTDWVQNLGQGYALTEEGGKILQNPGLLSRPLPKPQPVARLERGFEHEDSDWQRGEKIRNSLINPGRPVVTQALLIANIAVFLVGWYLASQNGIGQTYFVGLMGQVDQDAANKLNSLYTEMGSLNPLRVEVGQWWRLLSYAFLHGGILHILLNMYFLFRIGSLVEGLWGSWRYLILYVVGALAGGLGAFLSGQGAVGASGALCGLLLSMAVWLYMSRAHLPRELVMSWQSNLMTNVLLLVLISFMPNVSWAGHLGGALGGMAVAVGLHLNRFWPSPQRWAGVGIMAACPVLIFAMIYVPYSEPRDYNRNLYHPYRALDEDLKGFYKTYGARIIESGPNSLGADLPTAKGEIDRITQGFQDIEDRLKARSYQSPLVGTVASNLAITNKVLKTLAESFQMVLKHPESWDDEKQAELMVRVQMYQKSSEPDLKQGPSP